MLLRPLRVEEASRAAMDQGVAGSERVSSSAPLAVRCDFDLGPVLAERL